MKANIKNIIFFVLMILVFVFAAQFFINSDTAKKDEFTWNDVITLFEEDKVTSFVVESSGHVTIKALDDEGKEISYAFRISYTSQIEKLEELAEINRKKENPVLTDYDIKAPAETPWILPYLPYLIVIVLIIIMFVVMSRAANGMGGKMNSPAPARTSHRVTRITPFVFRTWPVRMKKRKSCGRL